MSKKDKQQTVSATETMKMTVELADNGIILRNPDSPDEVTLALQGGGTRTNDGYDYAPIEVHRAIGSKIYDWLMDVVILEHQDELVTTGFDITVKAQCTGRAMYE